MDVVKVVLSERVLCLGRVRMTYLFVTGPGMSMYGSGARLSSALSEVRAQKHETHNSLSGGRWSHHSRIKGTKLAQRGLGVVLLGSWHSAPCIKRPILDDPFTLKIEEASLPVSPLVCSLVNF